MKLKGNKLLVPRVFELRYGMNDKFKETCVAKGEMTICVSWLIVLLRPVLNYFKVLPPYKANKIPVTVAYSFNESANAINVDRSFYYPGNQTRHFSSLITFRDENVMVELSPNQLGITFIWEITNNQLVLNYRSYIYKFRHWLIRMPLGLMLGRCSCREVALSDSKFSMELQFTHPWFGQTYRYFGTFEMTQREGDCYAG